MIRAASLAALLAVLAALPGCDWMPGKPELSSKWMAPADIRSFTTLYAQNCAACHSMGLNPGPSLSLNDPLYLSFIPDTAMRSIIANGIHGTGMPAFSKTQGGPLNDQQIDILVSGINSVKTAANSPHIPLPPYTAPLGDVTRGAQVFSVYCASCHGTEGRGGTVSGSVVSRSYLALVSDQYLRTIVVAGRPDLGMPNWQKDVPGKSMSNQDIADVVAWLASHRQPPGTAIIPSQTETPAHE